MPGNTCNKVICEVLAFILNKLDVMDEESLVRICVTAFTAEDIGAAKALLFESVPSKKPKIRKREGKTQRNLDDIIVLFKETDPDNVLIFVAKDLYKLPPISFDHLDATKLLKDLLIMQKDMREIKETYVTKDRVDVIQVELGNLKNVSLINNFDFSKVNTNKRGAGPKTNFMFDSGPIGLQHIPDSDDFPEDGDLFQEGDFDSDIEEVSQVPPKLQITNPPHAPIRPPPEKIKQPLSPPIAERSKNNEPKGNVTHQNSEDKLFTTVVSRKNRRRQQFAKTENGSVLENSNFKAVQTNIPIFISKVSKETSEKDIIDYVFRKTQEKVSIVKLSIINEAKYNACKLFVPSQKARVYLHNKFWTAGIVFRRFINRTVPRTLV